MKKIIILLSLTIISWGAFAQHNHSNNKNNSKIASSIKVNQSNAASAVIDNYLAMAEALVKEDSKGAASLGQKLSIALSKFDAKEVSTQQKNEATRTVKAASQQANLIADNNGNIAKQREHFEHLSKGVKELIVIVGSDRPLYQAYCPMYKNNKGGAWLSASKEVYNPYFGDKMLRCGSIQQEISLK